MSEATQLYDLNAGFGRDGGPYLDDIEREQAEVRRAKIEGREPDLDNAGPVAGTVLVNADTLIKDYNPISHPSQQDVKTDLAVAVDKMAADDEHPLSSVAEIPAEVVASNAKNQELTDLGRTDELVSGDGQFLNQGENSESADSTNDSTSNGESNAADNAGGSESSVESFPADVTVTEPAALPENN